MLLWHGLTEMRGVRPVSLDAGLTREKLTANVSFPLKGLKLSDYSSKEAVIDEDGVECVLPFCMVSRCCSGQDYPYCIVWVPARDWRPSVLDGNIARGIPSTAGDVANASRCSMTRANTPIVPDRRYDLYGVINHFGSMAAGHYTAACRVPLGKGKEDWYVPVSFPFVLHLVGHRRQSICHLRTPCDTL